MNKKLVMFVLAATITALAQGASSSQQPASQSSDQANVPTGQKVIKDPAEYNAYITALNTQDPAAKATAMEAFIAQYPQSIVKMEAMTQAMAAYQQAGNQQKVEETARKILEIEPTNVRALAILVFIETSQANTPEKVEKVRKDAMSGLDALSKWTKPSDTSDADFAKLRNQMADIFEGAAGLGYLQIKDYAAARDHLSKAYQIDPTNLQDAYRLGITLLSMTPMDVNGLWYIAKAYNLAGANAAAKKAISDYGKAMYKRYHGGVDGWDELLAAAAAQPTLSPDFAASIKPAPTECDIAADAGKNAAELSFQDYEFVLSHRDCSAAAGESAKKVWQVIQDKQKAGEVKVKLPGVKVIGSAADFIDAALTEDNQAANKADVHMIMEKPMLHPPAPGATIDIIGVFTNYAPNPFMFTMEKGELPAAKVPPKPPLKKAPARRGAATTKRKPAA
jgi:tetratricopeptide (TPR) repeat protein